MSESHMRGISTTLALLDKALCEFEQWANGHEISSVLYHVVNPLSEAQRQLLIAEVVAMKAVLQEIGTAFSLEGTVRSADKMIVGSCSVLWASVVELESDRLKRYGELPAGLAEYLDPRVANLNRHLRYISQVIATGGDS